MTRRLVYAGALVAFVGVFAMTIASIVIPRWISWFEVTDDGTPIRYTYGLHSVCSSLTGLCTPFPLPEECDVDRTFCSMWRSVGFLMNFAVVVEGMTLIAFIVMMFGSLQKRIAGKTVITAFLVLVAVLQLVCMSLIAWIYDYDDRFFPGWELDRSYALCTASWVLSASTAGGIWVVSGLLPMEGDYELIPDNA